MGAIVTAANILNGVATGISMVNQAMEPLRPPPPDPSRQTEAMIVDDNHHARTQAQSEVDALERQRADDAKRKKDAVRRAVAARRARFGAQGAQAGDGSGEAVLLGVIDDGLVERDALARTTAARIGDVNNRLAHAHRSNLLQRQRLQTQRSLKAYNSQSGYFF
ncbi:hypothetical protein [Fodinicurvata sp. EGI_FJ10296]|uniref:hypothetical protein n=1 Tax=Fodinicurvata sp. EGI_FJ10296 TaxID=3231908 RepID=UPI00345595E2